MRVFAKYRKHRVKGKSRDYLYHLFETEFDGKTYESSSPVVVVWI